MLIRNTYYTFCYNLIFRVLFIFDYKKLFKTEVHYDVPRENIAGINIKFPVLLLQETEYLINFKIGFVYRVFIDFYLPELPFLT